MLIDYVSCERFKHKVKKVLKVRWRCCVAICAEIYKNQKKSLF